MIALAQLKSVISYPKLFLIHYFDELRRQVDMTYANEPNETNIWLEMIRLIKNFEEECFKSQLNKEFVNEIEQNIAFIESNLKNIVSDRIEKLIEIEEHKVKTYLFSNKTIMFLPQINNTNEKLEDKELEGKMLEIDRNVFDRKLIIINGLIFGLFYFYFENYFTYLF